MSREKTLVKNTFIITIGKVCTQLVSFLLLPLYTALLTSEEYGVVDLLNTLVSLLMPLVTLQIEQALFRELIEVRGDDRSIQRVITSGLGTICVQCALYSCVFLLLSPLVANPYKYFLATNVLASAITSILCQIARGLGDNRRYAVASFVSASSTIAFNVLFLVGAGLGARGMLLATLLGNALSSAYLVVALRLFRYVELHTFSRRIARSLLAYSIPLIPNTISWWIIDASDRVVVAALIGTDANGILAASLKFAQLITGLNYIVTLSWTESMAVAIDDADADVYFNKMLNIILSGFAAIGMGMIACMPFAYPLLINESYSYGYGLVPISIMATFFNVVVGVVSTVYVAKKDTRSIARTSALAAAINIASHLALIGSIGLYASVVSSLLSFCALGMYRVFDIGKRYFRVRVDRTLVTSTLVTLGLVLPAYYMGGTVAHVLALIVSVVYACLANRQLLASAATYASRLAGRLGGH